MVANKSERLLNLFILLLVSRTYVSKERIREAIEPYREQHSEEAFEKMFERDKDELRALGIPIEVGSIDAYFDDEPGYRVKRDAFELPVIDLEPDEAAVLGVAARVWQHAGLANATSQALIKLKAGGVETDREALDLVHPQLRADEPAFDAVWAATQSRTPIAFSYRRGDAPRPSRRRLQPWGVLTARGRWYVVGFDTDRDAPRLFRLSRISGEVASDGPEGSFTVPPGTDLRELTRTLQPPRTGSTAVLRVRRGTAQGLRRRAQRVEAGADGDADWDTLTVDFGSIDDLADEVLEGLDTVEAISPPELRELVVDRLRAAAHAGVGS